jgi:hypothetical protein
MGTLPGAFPQPLITHGFFGESKPLQAFSTLVSPRRLRSSKFSTGFDSVDQKSRHLPA